MELTLPTRFDGEKEAPAAKFGWEKTRTAIHKLKCKCGETELLQHKIMKFVPVVPDNCRIIIYYAMTTIFRCGDLNAWKKSKRYVRA